MATSLPLIEDADLVGELVDLHHPARPVGNAVVVAADRDQPVMADAAFQLEQRVEGEGGQLLQVQLLGSKGCPRSDRYEILAL